MKNLIGTILVLIFSGVTHASMSEYQGVCKGRYGAQIKIFSDEELLDSNASALLLFGYQEEYDFGMNDEVIFVGKKEIQEDLSIVYSIKTVINEANVSMKIIILADRKIAIFEGKYEDEDEIETESFEMNCEMIPTFNLGI